jgi:hypothetical protein
MIDAMLQDAEEHYKTLLQASPKPHVLDDYIVGRVFEVFGRRTNSALASAMKWTDWASKSADAGLSSNRSFRSLNN